MTKERIETRIWDEQYIEMQIGRITTSHYGTFKIFMVGEADTNSRIGKSMTVNWQYIHIYDHTAGLCTDPLHSFENSDVYTEEDIDRICRQWVRDYILSREM